MTQLRKFLLVAIVSVVPGAATASNSCVFPKEVLDAGDGSWCGLAAELDEPALWTNKSLNHYRQRLRLMFQGPRPGSWSIRIDDSGDGKRLGYFVAADRRHVVRKNAFRVLDADMVELGRLIDQAKLWTIYPEFWRLGPDEVCVDGVVLIFERIDEDGYRYSEANAQCTASAALLAVAAKMMTMAHRTDLLELLH